MSRVLSVRRQPRRRQQQGCISYRIRAAARAAGAAPVHRSDPGYGVRLGRGDDGVGVTGTESEF
ncbi:excalibur calcium-binding domain-containing protein [Streptomyces sp. enrichment culture]|uniref:excalibur calcium-binding domain-containing protein n=1 Tax=Streptomyces sp. enrichment culture TaxID=1795815 RepID=UPI003F5441C6